MRGLGGGSIVIPILFLIMLMTSVIPLSNVLRIRNIYCGYQCDLTIRISGFLKDFNRAFHDLLQNQSYGTVTRELARAVLGAPDVPSCSYVLTNTSVREDINRLMEFLHVYKNLAEGISRKYSINLPYLNDKEINEIQKLKHYILADDIVPVCSIIDDYKELRRDAGEILMGNDDAIPQFYEKLFTVSLKIIFMQESTAYKVSYKTIGTVFIRFGLYKTIYEYGGKTALKVAMSTAHWAMRDYISAFIDKFPGEIDELINHINNQDFIWIVKSVIST